MLKIALKQYMTEHHLTIQDVTDMTGISRPTVSQLAAGKAKGIQFETLSRLANGLDADVSELFDNQYQFETIKYYVKSLIPDDSLDLSDDYQATIEVGFYYDDNIHDDSVIVEFRVPTRISIQKPLSTNDAIVYALSWNYEDLGEWGIENYNEQKLYDFLSSTPLNYLENLLAEITQDVLGLVEKNKSYKKPNYVSFTSDFPIHRIPGELLTFVWDVPTLKNKELLESILEIKYGSI